MSNSTINNENDRFNDLFRQKLEQYEAPLKDGLWNNIESKIRPAKKRFALLPAISAAAVALVLLSIFLWNPLNDATETPATIAELEIASSEIVEEIQVFDNTNGQSATFETAKKRPATKEKLIAGTTVIAQKNTVTVSPIKESEIPLAENLNQHEQPVSSVEIEKNIEKEIGNVPELNENLAEEKNTEQKNGDSLPLYEKNTFWQEERAKTDKFREKQKKKGWQLAANYGAKNGIDLGVGNHNDLMMNDPSESYSSWSDEFALENVTSSNPNKTIYSQAKLTPEDFSQKTFLPTLSFGLTLRKNLNNYFSVESGLAYTYLQTRFFHNGINKYDAKSELHYLGIPLNAVVSFINNSQWNLYLSAGGMIEKGLREKFSQNIYLNNETCPSERIEKIKGVQFSLNGALGVSYNIFDHFGVYLEPRISYYFDSDQPYSVRTEKATVFGLSVGLKYSL
jgi:hypothetical protein